MSHVQEMPRTRVFSRGPRLNTRVDQSDSEDLRHHGLLQLQIHIRAAFNNISCYFLAREM